MRYKVNDEVLIKARIKDMSYVDMMYVCELVTNSDVCIRFKSPSECIVTDKTYSDGLKDAWELAKKIILATDDGGISLNDITEIFGSAYCAMMDFTYEQALAKIEAYEKENEIKVGDEVRNTVTSNTFWIIAKSEENLIGYPSSPEFHDFPVQRFPRNFDFLVKTGRTTDCIDLLRQIGE